MHVYAYLHMCVLHIHTCACRGWGRCWESSMILFDLFHWGRAPHSNPNPCSLIQLVLLASFLRNPLSLPLRLGLHAGHHANPAFYMASRDPNSGPHTCVAKYFNHGVNSCLLYGLCTPRTCSPSVSALRVGVTGMLHHEWPLPAFLSFFFFLRQDLFM